MQYETPVVESRHEIVARLTWPVVSGSGHTCDSFFVTGSHGDGCGHDYDGDWKKKQWSWWWWG